MSKYKKLELKDFGVKREERILKNGCKVVLYEKKNSPLYMSVRFLAGARFDPVGKEGLAHLVEHSLVMGAKRFKSKDTPSEFLERHGGSFSLSTNTNFINISADIGNTSNINVLFEFLNEIINNPRFLVKDFKNEKHVIFNEIQKRQSNKQLFFSESFLNILYAGTSYEKSNIGNEKSVSSIEIKDVISFYKKNITPQRCLIVASGDINIQKLVKGIEQKIKFKNNISTKVDLPPYLVPNKGVSENIKIDHLNQTMVRVGFRLDPDFDFIPVFNILIMVLSRGRSSRLIKSLRYKKGLIYSTLSSNNFHQDMAVFSVGANTIDKDPKKVVEAILDEIEDIKLNGLTKKELNFIKEYFYNSAPKNLQTSKDWVESNLSYVHFGNMKKTNIDIINDITRVTNNDIKRAAKKYFLKEKMFLVVGTAK